MTREVNMNYGVMEKYVHVTKMRMSPVQDCTSVFPRHHGLFMKRPFQSINTSIQPLCRSCSLIHNTPTYRLTGWIKGWRARKIYTEGREKRQERHTTASRVQKGAKKLKGSERLEAGREERDILQGGNRRMQTSVS